MIGRIAHVGIEKLPEGPHLATSDAVQGLVAQRRTITGTLAIARNVARRLLAAQAERDTAASSVLAAGAFDYYSCTDAFCPAGSRFDVQQDAKETLSIVE